MSGRWLLKVLPGVVSAMLAATPSLAADWSLVVAGLGGTDPYLERFPEQADELGASLREAQGSEDRVVVLSGDEATLETIETSLETLNARIEPADSFNLFLIGHGAYDGRQYKFNIPGPDLSAEKLVELLDRLKSKSQLVVAATSSSGALLESISNENRTLITATKSANERTAVHYASAFIDALNEDNADLDKDGLITAEEAHQFSVRQIEVMFETEQLLATEHSRVEGDIPTLYVGRLNQSTPVDSSDPVIAGLLQERDEIESRIAALRAEREQLDENSYFDQLEPLMLELAVLQARIDRSAESSPRSGDLENSTEIEETAATDPDESFSDLQEPDLEPPAPGEVE